jgi:hypothetical protein
LRRCGKDIFHGLCVFFACFARHRAVFASGTPPWNYRARFHSGCISVNLWLKVFLRVSSCPSRLNLSLCHCAVAVNIFLSVFADKV